jgi:hypothetical protein
VMESSFLMLCCSKAGPALSVNLQKRNKRKNLKFVLDDAKQARAREH